MNMSKYALERTFFTQSKFNARDSEASDILKDKIYKGMFHDELVKAGYTQAELTKAVRNGWLKKTHVAPNGTTLRLAYLWTQDELPQYKAWKRALDRVYRFVTGDYSRYYGKG
jgi:hypothetical protein